MRRLLARFRDSRNKVNSSNKEGKTEKSIGFKMYIDTNKTSTDAVMLKESKISNTKEGTGTSMTKTVATAAAGTIQSVGDFAGGRGLSGVAAMIQGQRLKVKGSRVKAKG
jgi:hypothetical protein